MRIVHLIVAWVIVLGIGSAQAQDWPQWRGPNRDGKVTGFTAPKSWPKDLKKTWTVTVGDGVATPALVGDKLYVFSREGGDEVIRCLNAADGKEVWKEKYASAGFQGIDASFQGPRSSPAVADGKVVTLGAQGILSCFDAAKGTRLWQKHDIKEVPGFHVSSSPIIVNGLAIAQLGGGGRGGRGGAPGGGKPGGSGGAIVAYDLTTGDQKWKWTGGSPAYGSPSLLTLGDTKAILAETAGTAVAVNVADGKLLWEIPFTSQYNGASPVVDGQTVILTSAGAGTKALKLTKDGDKADAKELWNRPAATQFNTPVLKDGLLFGISSSNSLFCVKADTGETAWKTSLGGGGGGGGMMGRYVYGTVVDAGSVLFALNPSGQLLVFEPTAKEFKQLAKYSVAKGDTYAYPVVSGNRIFVKDKNAVTLWTIE